jgi:CheY-like chemotaxis protein
LAEDEESVRRLLRHLLDASGYQVLEAADGANWLRKPWHRSPV